MSGSSPNARILAGFAVGVAGGVLANALWKGAPELDWVVRNIADPVGQIFLRMLLMVVIPLVFASVTVGIATLGGMRDLGRIGGKTFGFYLAMAVVGAVVGVTLAAVVRPGDAVTAAMRASLAAGAGAPAEPGGAAPVGIGTLVNIVPSNVFEAAAKGEMLGVLFFTVVFGAALANLPAAVAAPVLRFLEGIAQVSGAMVRLAMAIAPLGVAGLAFSGFARFGFEFLRPLGLYVAVVLGGLLLQMLGVYALLVRVVGQRPWGPFLRRSQPAMVTALATASSSATLPTTLRVAQAEPGVSPAIAGFVVPLGASLSRAGTSIFSAATALFLAQALGLAVGPLSALLVITLATVTAIAAGGIPSGVIPLLATVVAAAGVPSGAIAVILGVEPILGMVRTVVNVTGGLVAAVVVGRTEPAP